MFSEIICHLFISHLYIFICLFLSFTHFWYMILFISYRNNLLCNGLSLKSLAETVLNFPLDKSLVLRCSNWDAENLTEDQVLLIRIVEEWKSHCLWSIIIFKILILKYDIRIRQKGLKIDSLCDDTQGDWSIIMLSEILENVENNI